MLNPYTKAILAAVLAVATALATGFDDSLLTKSEIWVAAGAGLVSLGAVWGIPWLKWLWSGLIAGVAAVGVALNDDAISAQEWITIVIAVVTALYVVYQVPNTEDNISPVKK